MILLLIVLNCCRFFFLTYLAMEYLEHKTSAKGRRSLSRILARLGPVIGALLGAVPQCGFSTAASNLYAGKVITMGNAYCHLYVYFRRDDTSIFIRTGRCISACQALYSLRFYRSYNGCCN